MPPKKSNEASLVKLADTTSNIGAIANSPPDGWSLERRLEYIGWANTVVGHLPLLPKEGLAEFLSRCDQARSVRLRMLLLEHPDTSIFSIGSGAVRRIRTRIGLLAQPESMRSIIGATQREKLRSSAWNWFANRGGVPAASQLTCIAPKADQSGVSASSMTARRIASGLPMYTLEAC